MKNLINFINFIAIVAIIGFTMACGGGDDSGNPPDTTPDTPPTTVQPFDDITATQWVSKIKIGWNLGNALDTAPLTGTGHYFATNGSWPGLPANPTVAQMETAWYNPVTSKANITKIKGEGFNAIRIIVSWLKAADLDGNIRADWMKRVTQVVNYAATNDMYIILNSHHDEMEHFNFTNAGVDASLVKFNKMWGQIAEHFKNYDEKLIFEALNEPRNKAGTPAEWNGSPEAYTNINKHYQSFVNIVRASGGNNNKRILMVNPFAAQCQSGTLNGLELPTDTPANKIIVSVHMYYPYAFTHAGGSPDTDTWSKDNSSDTSDITNGIDLVYNTFVSTGIPVLIGEFSSQEKNNNTAARAAWAEFVSTYIKSKGIPGFYFDDGIAFSILNRETNTIRYPAIVTELMKGANTVYTPPTPPTITGNLGNYTLGSDGTNTNHKQAVWELSGENLTAAQTAGTKLVLVFTVAPSGKMAFVWQAPDKNIWWQNDNDIFDNGSALGEVTWNAGTKTLTIPLSALADYEDFKTESSPRLVIEHFGTETISALGITKANLE